MGNGVNDCVIIGMCSEALCNENEMFMELANSANSVKNAYIMLGLSIILIQQFAWNPWPKSMIGNEFNLAL